MWVAEDHKLSRSVAVKLLSASLVADPELRRRFERGAGDGGCAFEKSEASV